ncbi:MAG: metalloregulator ArsR/SmtB family transcription factor [Thermoplasmata archaeon]
MRARLPDEIEEELGCLGGLEGLSRLLPGADELRRLALLHSALSDGTRLRILLALTRGELCVCVLRELTRCSGTRLSYHLSVLRRAGLVSFRRDRSFLRYSLTPSGRRVAKRIFNELARDPRFPVGGSRRPTGRSPGGRNRRRGS